MNLENLLNLMGMPINCVEIKNLFESWGIIYPKKLTVTPNNSSLGTCKMDKDGLSLNFHFGGNSRHLKPIPSDRKGTYVARFSFISFGKKYKGELPFQVVFGMSNDELTAILGEPKVTVFMGTATTWRKSYLDKYELVVFDNLYDDNTNSREIRIAFMWENDLDTLEDYEKAGL
jgi:hypothetical protein